MIARWIPKTLAVSWVVSVVACTLTVDEEGLGREYDACAANEKLCEDEDGARCVGLDDPSFGCARLNCASCYLEKATPTCSPASGQCVIAACTGSYEDCDNADSNGCEVNVDTDVKNCGGCGMPCPEKPNAEVSCGGARCYIRVCEDGYGDCNKTFQDGCEADLSTSNNHCGGCNMPCFGTCVDGQCEI